MKSSLAEAHFIVILTNFVSENFPLFDFSIRISEFYLLTSNNPCEILEAITSK